MTTAARFKSDNLIGKSLSELVGLNVKCALVTSGWTPNVDTQDFWDDIVGNEVAGTGYTAGGVSLTGKVAAQHTGLDYAYLIADNPTWAAISVSFRFAVFYVSTGVASTSPLLLYADFGGTQTLSSAPLVIEIANADNGGLIKESS
jgi:hypothetical protein